MGLWPGIAGLVFLLLFYAVRGIATPVLRNQINEITPSDIRATVLSVRSLIIRLSFSLLGPFLGWHADRSGLPDSLVIAGLLFLAGGVASALLIMRVGGRVECRGSQNTG